MKHAVAVHGFALYNIVLFLFEVPDTAASIRYHRLRFNCNDQMLIGAKTIGKMRTVELDSFLSMRFA